MILVIIAYTPNLFDDPELEYIQAVVEPAAGYVFGEELDHVDVEFRPYGFWDEHSYPMLVTVEVDLDHIDVTALVGSAATLVDTPSFQRQLANKADAFHVAFDERLREFMPAHRVPVMRVRVQASLGIVSDPGRGSMPNRLADQKGNATS